MKKTISFLCAALCLLLLTSCKIKEYTPEIPSQLTQNAAVTSGDFSYDCEICKNEKGVTVTVKSTNAKGMIMTYDGKNINYVYAGYGFDIAANNSDAVNAAVVVYDALSCLSSADIKKHKIDGGCKYEGKINAGNFILIQNDDNSLKNISLKNKSFHIEFE